MKKLIGLVALAIMSLPFLSTTAQAEMIEGVEINRSAQAVNFTQSIDMSRWRTAGVQSVYSDGTPSSHTLTSGIKQSGTIVVPATTTGLIAAQASLTINVVSTAAVQNDSVTLNGIVFAEGTHWEAVTSSSTAATALKTIIDAHPDFEATVAGATVTVKYITYGTSGNGLPASTTDASNLVLSASTFGSGVNAYNLIVNGITLTAGTDFTVTSSSLATTSNITAAINANSTLSGQVIASSSAVTVTVSALYPGRSGYYITSSTTGFTITALTQGLASDIDLANDIITKASHGFTTGLKVRYDTVSGTAPGGLTTGTTYFAIALDGNRYQLATSSTNAVAGTDIDLTTLPITASSYGMTPQALSVAAGNGFYWQGSNDNSNFSSLSISSVTYSAAGNTLWDLGEYAYKYLRMVFTGPTNGGIAISVRIYGREE